MIIFLGDMLATGKYAKDASEYARYKEIFDSFFRINPPVPMYYLPGNNDVGMGLSPSVSKHVRDFYQEHFGDSNQKLDIRGHSFVFLDAPSIVDEDYQRNARYVGYDSWTPLPDGPIDFVKNVRTDERPIILFSHVPLARPDTASCGPHREKGTIRRNVGHGYQSTLGKATTHFLLQSLNPSAVFSGDNRDYCEYTHRSASSGVREITIKSFSPTRHIRHPGFELLSLVTPTQPRHAHYADRSCLLPSQHELYTGTYPFLAVLTLTAVVVSNLLRLRNSRKLPLTPTGRSPGDRNGSPLLRVPDSAIWSPYTPSIPHSPLSKFPPLRTPNSPSRPATMRASSRPGSPFGTPVLEPMIAPAFDEDEEDAMYPAQFINMSGDQVDSLEDALEKNSPLSSTPSKGWRPADRSSPAWTWTFVFRGRLRRFTLSVPALTSLLEYLCGVGEPALVSRRRTVFRGTLQDSFAILWPVFLVWSIITWWTA
ncbi:hypothetical protein HGRIS_002601 [Hohenbuehelia grisea]